MSEAFASRFSVTGAPCAVVVPPLMPPVTHAYRAYRRVTLKRSALMLSSAVAALVPSVSRT